ncbi:hypothetical protein, partial [Streptomyces anulatus]|uniref:hypothetical protein n=1 Tax=Streptomyces anulatus TaxID=1892 RepID=UPI003423F3B8
MRETGGNESDGVAFFGIERVGVDESPIDDHNGAGSPLKGQAPQQAAEKERAVRIGEDVPGLVVEV